MRTLIRDGDADEWPPYGPMSAVRVKIGPEDGVAQPDPLGRHWVGWRDGLTAAELWDRGRGVWKFKAKQAISSDVLLIAADGIVRMVGTVDGLSKHGDRLAIEGAPLPDHPLIGQRDPLDNRPSNPIGLRRRPMNTEGWD